MNNRPIKAGDLYATFIFDGKDCADMGIYSVSNSGTYTVQIVPTFKDETLEVPNYDGKYYFGTQYSVQQFQFNMFADNLSLEEYKKLKLWLSPKKIGKLVLPDQPYKYYIVKVTSVGTLAQYPLTDIQTPSNSVLGDFLEGNVVYTGKFTITFQTVGSVYGYGFSYYRDDLIYDAKDFYSPGTYPDYYYYDSGLLYKDMNPAMNWSITTNNIEYNVPIYNPGDAPAYPIYTLHTNTVVPNNGKIILENVDANETAIVNLSGLSGDIIIDFDEEYIESNGVKYYDRIDGDTFKISAESDVITIPESMTQDTESFYIRDYDNIYIEHEGTAPNEKCIVYINPLALQVKEEWKNKYYFCINFNGGALITDVNVSDNSLTLDNNVLTYDIPAATQQRPAGFECNYIGTYNNEADIIATASRVLGNVANTNDNIWYIYRYNSWQKTNLFSSDEIFKDNYGNYQPYYLVFGGTIVKMGNITLEANNMPNFTISAVIVPRYL